MLDEKPNSRNRVRGRDWGMSPLIIFNQKREQLDRLHLRARGVIHGSQLEEGIRIGCKLLIIVYEARSTVGDHLRGVCENFPHFVPNLLSQFLGLLYSLCLRKDRM